MPISSTLPTTPTLATLEQHLTEQPPATRAQLLLTLRLFSQDPGIASLVDLAATDRQWHEVARTPQLQVWVISWPPGTSTGWHDHGGAVGAFRVVRGSLEEHTVRDGRRLRTLAPGDLRVFSGSHVHDVRNTGAVPALSVHAYSPRLDAMTRYVETDGRLEAHEVDGGERW
ncbi:cysteine dioxygenase [Luteipulveratus flavus]|uniref:Cysteine dioxygenase family protein n=1 Tax=Luteipulveratus flavus TaxID=3031728 RepID=A0ABT6C7S5_9MICO|nr:cysteine dioxygenase family protein [Luteipulveratus sp. YIM 133296]MDF8263336.1 cysteine dioxygenase family protein [Luteipulveratus sp. YIM 133296]